VIVEGLYLLHWGLRGLFTEIWYIDVDDGVCVERLIERRLRLGYSRNGKKWHGDGPRFDWPPQRLSDGRLAAMHETPRPSEPQVLRLLEWCAFKSEGEGGLNVQGPV
jgi:hypothetical protein